MLHESGMLVLHTTALRCLQFVSSQAVDDVAPAVDDAASQQLAAAASEVAQLRARVADAERAAAEADEVGMYIRGDIYFVTGVQLSLACAAPVSNNIVAGQGS